MDGWGRRGQENKEAASLSVLLCTTVLLQERTMRGGERLFAGSLYLGVGLEILQRCLL